LSGRLSVRVMTPLVMPTAISSVFIDACSRGVYSSCQILPSKRWIFI